MKLTEGEWVLQRRGFSFGVKVHGDEGEMIASQIYNEADAHLLKAAKDLLLVAEAVKLRGHAEDCISRGRGNVGQVTCDCLMAPALAALAKAGGK